MKNIRHLMIVTVAAAGLALAGCGGGGDGISTSERDAAVEEAVKKERMALQMTIDELEARLGIEGDTDPGDDVATLKAEIKRLNGLVMAQEMAQEEAIRKAAEAAAAAMAVTAAKLYDGIGAPTDNTSAMTRRYAAYNDAGTMIAVSIGEADAAVNLSEDKKTVVADNHGWTGKKYAASPTGGGTYESVVYSNVGEPTEGKAFDSTGGSGLTAVDETSGEFTIPLSGQMAARIESTSFDHNAGEKTFELPDNHVRVTLSGSYYGVSGEYYCTPTADDACGATVAADGFTLGGGSWTFKPTDPKAKVMSTPDAIYASYGWWLHKPATGSWVASAFAANRGGVDAAESLDTLKGKATYMGGAAGKYALSSSTGGINDAGHFTARATLEADFTNNTAATAITGTIEDFIGADGEARDWSVALGASPIQDDGDIGVTDTNAVEMTTWTIDGTPAAASGNWTGALRNNGTDGVPQVATGTFYSEYGTAGKMVGAFGANKQ